MSKQNESICPTCGHRWFGAAAMTELVDRLQQTSQRWGVEANKLDEAGQFCCARTQRADAGELFDLLRDPEKEQAIQILGNLNLPLAQRVNDAYEILVKSAPPVAAKEP